MDPRGHPLSQEEMMRKLIAVAALTMTCFSAPGAHAAPNLAVAGPAAWVGLYVTEQITIKQSESLTFANLDPTAKHDVVSLDLDSQGRKLFSSELISVGTAPVTGVEALPTGSYAFSCSVHSNMTGTLTVEP
jgi:plastocyanin